MEASDGVQASVATQFMPKEPSDVGPAVNMAAAPIDVCIDLTEEEDLAATDTKIKMKRKKKPILTEPPSAESKTKKKAVLLQRGSGGRTGDAKQSSESLQPKKRKAQSRKNPDPKKYVTKKPKKEVAAGKKANKETIVMSDIITESIYGDLELPTAEVF